MLYNIFVLTGYISQTYRLLLAAQTKRTNFSLNLVSLRKILYIAWTRLGIRKHMQHFSQ